VAEGFLDDHARVASAAGSTEFLHHCGEQAGRDGQVMGRTFGVAKLIPESVESGGVAVVAVHIAEQLDQPGKRFFVYARPGMFQAVAGAGAELFQVPPCLGDAMTGTFNRPRRTNDCKAGKIFL